MKGVKLSDLEETAKNRPEGYLEEVLSYVVERRDGVLLFEPDDYYMLRDKYSGDVSPMVRGPGTELHKLLGRFGIHMKKGCSCRGRMIQMNRWGCDGCEGNIETILAWLREEADKRCLPFVKPVARMLVHRAIANARKEASRGKTATT